MLTNEEIINFAKETLDIESSSLIQLKEYISSDLVECVKKIADSKGRVVITGIGKSAIIAQKIAATFNSTGTPSLFMHAADAIHGDLGMIQEHDIVICISKSGETPEIKALVPLLKRNKNLLIAIVGQLNSTLALQADLVLNTTVEKEACPNNLAPTTSTIAQMAMGDALAVCLLNYRDFTSEDFAKYHPGGALGKKLYFTLENLVTDNKPQINKDASIREVISAISLGRMGAVAVIEGDSILGIITDGDLRRMIEKHDHFNNIYAHEIMNTKAITLDSKTLAAEALEIFREKKISQVIVTKNSLYAGMVHIHDLNKEGII
ncbi:MAG: KpsF/GutQ family sugar-phosphate isomerase [Bacteroidetes bacterium]|nr:KpsF/GutQ family sugar-phosphate isomerase [Bacteroidota bacterium]